MNKRKETVKRWCVMLLAGLLALTMLLTACQPTAPSEESTTGNAWEETTDAAAEVTTQDSTESDTASESGEVTETESETETDYVDNGNYVTSSGLEAVLPEYTYSDSGMSSNDSRNDGILTTYRDTWSDTWTLIDSAGREIALPGKAGTYYEYNPRTMETKLVEGDIAGAPNDRQVGIFYFLWRASDTGGDGTNINPLPAYDHHAAYTEGGLEKLWEVLQLGPEAYPHYWAEPYFGYYGSNDRWVLRKHAYMLADAGVDFVFFDTTNNNLHKETYEVLIQVWEEMRREGYETPKFAFMCGGFPEEFQDLWNSVYKPGIYEDLWFYWDGKPLLLTSSDVIMNEAMNEEQKAFFTHRLSWAGTDQPWFDRVDGCGCWPWSDDWPQNPGRDYDGTVEQMVVMCGTGAGGGRSRFKGYTEIDSRTWPGEWDMGYALMDTLTPLGIRFMSQFEEALKKNPEVIMITGWNEWIAGRWSGAGAGVGGAGSWTVGQYSVSDDPSKKESSYYVDQFDPEYSRDIEPMKGGFGDNYFLQMAEYIRLYTGARDVETAFGQRGIDMNGSVGQWYEVGPEYRDPAGDITTRLQAGHVGGTLYYNNTGRNDIVTAKISNYGGSLYFYAECASTITEAEGENWMNLFIDADNDLKTGWYGYDFLLNRARDSEYVSIEKFVGTNTWEFETVGKAVYTVKDNTIWIKVSKALLGFGDTLNFKWADNSITDGEIMGFMELGDVAPNDRYSYRYTLTETTASATPDVLTNDMVVLKSRSYNAYVNGEMVRLVDNNTNGVLLGSGERIWLPVAFLKDVFGIDVGDAQTYDHYGIAYVEATDLLKAAGKVITVCPTGLVVIADEAVTNESTLRVLYRSLT